MYRGHQHERFGEFSTKGIHRYRLRCYGFLYHKGSTNKGIDINIGHDGSKVIGADLVVYTSAIITSGENQRSWRPRRGIFLNE